MVGHTSSMTHYISITKNQFVCGLKIVISERPNDIVIALLNLGKLLNLYILTCPNVIVRQRHKYVTPFIIEREITPTPHLQSVLFIKVDRSCLTNGEGGWRLHSLKKKNIFLLFFFIYRKMYLTSKTIGPSTFCLIPLSCY